MINLVTPLESTTFWAVYSPSALRQFFRCLTLPPTEFHAITIARLNCPSDIIIEHPLTAILVLINNVKKAFSVLRCVIISFPACAGRRAGVDCLNAQSSAGDERWQIDQARQDVRRPSGETWIQVAAWVTAD